MLYFVITLTVIGAILGLIFSRNGEEGQSMLSGAKEGAQLGCGCILIPILVIAGIVLLAIFSV